MITCGITCLPELIPRQTIEIIQKDIKSWCSFEDALLQNVKQTQETQQQQQFLPKKNWNIDQHITFDGNTNEHYLRNSEKLSEVATNPTILSILTAVYGAHPRGSFFRTYLINPIQPYQKRAFAWHHDGWGKSQIKVMILLSDVEEDGQRMKYCPGTHEIEWDCSRSKETQFNNAFAEQFKFTNCCGKAGTAFIFFPNAIHTGVRNLSKRRDVIVLAFEPGIARNYQLPGIHDKVQKEVFSCEYLHAIYRTREKYEFKYEDQITESNFEEENEKWKKLSQDLFQEYQIPAKQIIESLQKMPVFNNSAIQQDSLQNVMIFQQNQIPIFKNQSEIENQYFLDMVLKNTYNEALSNSDLDFEEFKSKIILIEFQKDINIDLNLPIRMHHPFQDQLRDTVIVRIRDREHSEYQENFLQQLKQLKKENLVLPSFSDIQNIIRRTKNEIEENYEILQEIQISWLPKISCIQHFLTDLEEMISWSDNIDILKQVGSYTKKIAIIGAGPMGISTAFALSQNEQYNFQLFEAEDDCGGLAKSIVDSKGYIWDIGGHISFVTEQTKEFYKIIDKLQIPYNNYRRNSKIFLKGKLVDYPIQQHFDQLGYFLDTQKIYNEIEENKQTSKIPENCKEWFVNNCGQTLCDIFLQPYNNKLWKCPLEKMNIQWCSKLFYVKNQKEVVNLNFGDNLNFRYPKKGNGQIWQAILKQIPSSNVKFKHKVEKINVSNKTIYFNNGKQYQYDILISTMPLNLLTNQLEVSTQSNNTLKSEIEQMQGLAQHLKYSGLLIIGFVIQGQLPQIFNNVTWIYFSEENCPFFRITVLSNYSKEVVQNLPNQWSLLIEVSLSKEEIFNQNEYQIINESKNYLFQSKLLNSEEHQIISEFSKKIEYGYPTPTIERDQIIQQIIPNLQEKFNIISIGRFGNWCYEHSNQHYCFVKGKELANDIKYY